MPELTSPNGTPVSKLCFGAMQFGNAASARDSEEMFDACRAVGLTFFDTAHAYTGGASETLLGQFAASERESLVIATKAAYTGGSSRDNILSSFDVSRKRLKMDSVDILYLHRWDADTPLEETFEALAALQSDGLIRYIGVSNFAAWQVMKAQAVAETFGTRIDILQPMYSLVKRQVEVEILPMAQSEGLAVASYSPLGGGLLTGKYATGGGDGRLTTDHRYAARYQPDWMHSAARGLMELAEASNVSPATLAVAWVARNPGITAPIVSARNAQQLQVSLLAEEFEMSDDIYDQIAALAPMPAPATDRLEEA